MEIQKIFSSWDDEERLYSVLMDEEELRIFGRFMKEITKDVEPEEGVEKKKYYRKAVGNTVGAGLNGYLAQDLLRYSLKNKSKVAGVGAAIAGSNALYHTSRAVQNVKKGRKAGKKKD